MSIQNTLQNIIEKKIYSTSEIAYLLKVTPSTVNRWLNGKSNPKSSSERLIKEISNDAKTFENSKKLLLDSSIQYEFDNLLTDLREAFHRRSKFSSRNQAIEELCKLLLAQIKMIKMTNKGLESYNMTISSVTSGKELITYINTNIESSMPKTLAGDFTSEDFNLNIKSSEYKLLNDILDAFKKIDWKKLDNLLLLDIFNETFGKFLSNSFVDEKQLGQYLTPIEVVRIMVNLAIDNMTESDKLILTHPEKCKEFGYILDPSCGVGSFLIELLHALLPTVTKLHGDKGAKEWLKNMGKHVLVGIDKSSRMIKISITYFASLGIECEHLFAISSLDKDDNLNILEVLLDNNVALILTNPPFGAEFKGKDLLYYKIATTWVRSIPKKIDSEILFIERYVDWLSPKGNCISIFPDSILTNKGIYCDLRNGIKDAIVLNRVISLPHETFSAAGTSTKTSIVDFTKSKVNQNYEVYFSVCKNIGFKVITQSSQKKKIATLNNDMPQVLEECTSNNCDYKIGRTIKFDPSIHRWDANFHASLPNYIYRKLRDNTNKVYVRDIAILVNQRVDPRRSTGEFQYIEISNVSISSTKVSSKTISCSEAPSRARKLVRLGDVLASTVRPEQKKIGVVTNPCDDGSVCTTGFAVLRPLQIDSLLLANLLKTEFITSQLIQNNVGIAYPSVEESCFLDLVLPINKQELEHLGNKSRQLMLEENKLESMRNSLNQDISSHVKSWLSV